MAKTDQHSLSASSKKKIVVQIGQQPKNVEKKIDCLFIPGIIFEAILLAAIVAFAVLLRQNFYFPTTPHRFSCSDPTIAKDYVDPQNSQYPYRIDERYAYIINFAIPIFLICLGELIHNAVTEKPKKSLSNECFQLNNVARRLFRHIGGFILGAAITSIVVDVMKCIFGRLRPNFLQICKAECPPNQTDLMGLQNCTTSDYELLTWARHSFPSYNASITVFCATFVVIYFTSVLRLRGSYILGQLVTSAAIVWTSVISMQLWIDNRHHIEDLIVALLLGAFIAWYQCVPVLRKFRDSSPDFVFEAEKCQCGTHNEICAQSDSQTPTTRYVVEPALNWRSTIPRAQLFSPQENEWKMNTMNDIPGYQTYTGQDATRVDEYTLCNNTFQQGIGSRMRPRDGICLNPLSINTGSDVISNK